MTIRKKIYYIAKILAATNITILIITTLLALTKGVDINLTSGFNIIISLIFSIFLFQIEKNNVQENNSQKTRYTNFLVFCGIFLSIVEGCMFYEEIVKARGSISCAIAAIAAYTLFKSAYKLG